MKLTRYIDPRQFLNHAQAYLEQHEAATSLILGNVLRLAQEAAETSAYLAVAEADTGIALVAMLTPPHRLVLWGEQPANAAALSLLAADLHTHSWNVTGVLGPPLLAEPCLAEWQTLTRRPWRLTMNERIYQLTAVIPPPIPSGHMRLAETADLALVAEWIEAFTVEAIGTSDPAEAQKIAETKIANRSMYRWDDNQPVTMVGHGRATPRSSTISLVYTPPAFRRRGYAMACVASLSQQLLDDGKTFCTLFTDLDNATSNSVYQQIGYRPVCDFNAYDFDQA